MKACLTLLWNQSPVVLAGITHLFQGFELGNSENQNA
jgi:hypothetical protein